MRVFYAKRGRCECYDQSTNKKSNPKLTANRAHDRALSRKSRNELLTKNNAIITMTCKAICGVNKVKVYTDSTPFIDSPWQVKPE